MLSVCAGVCMPMCVCGESVCMFDEVVCVCVCVYMFDEGVWVVRVCVCVW